MTTWYVDYDGGTDVNSSAGNGDSFATRRKKLTNLPVSALVPGDTIKVMGSPAPTSLGVTGAWTNGPQSISITPTSSTNATPIVVTKTGHGLATGDTVVITGHTTNTKANGVWNVTVSGDTFTLLKADGSNSVGNGVGGATGTFRKINNCIVTLASALTANIACFGNQGTKTNWTASANVTSAVITTNFKEGGEAIQLTIASAFTTGLAAYYPTGTLNLSGYKQLSFWIYQTAGTVGAAGSCTITLCSDTAGVTAVDTFNIPLIGATSRWQPVTVDKGSALGASIQSIAFNVVTDNGTQTFVIDNFIACKDSTAADSLSLQSLIGKNTAGECMWPIQSINGTRVVLDDDTSIAPTTTSNHSGYFGTTETVTAYKQETTKTIPGSAATQVQVLNSSGTSGSPITISGGWNRTDMTTQTLDTVFDGLNGNGYGFYISSKSYIVQSNISFARYNQGWYGVNSPTTTNNTITIPFIIGCTSGGYNGGGNQFNTINITNCINNGAFGVISGSNEIYNITNMSGCSPSGLIAPRGQNCTFNATTLNCGRVAYGVVFGSASSDNILNITTINNAQSGYYDVHSFNIIGDSIIRNCNMASTLCAANVYVSATARLFLQNCTLANSTEFATTTGYPQNDAGVYSHNHDNTADNHYIALANGNITSSVAVRHTASGISWKMSPTDSTYCVTGNPLPLAIAKIACAANVLVTASVWMQRTNTGLTARLVCKGKQIAGVAADVSTSMTVAADTWENVTITFTPTEVGVVELIAEAYGGTTYSVYVDDFSWS